MAWTAPRTWTTAELVTASMLNTHVRDNLTSLYDAHGAMAQSTGYSFNGAGAFTKIQITSEQWDPFGWFDSTTNYRFLPTIAGKYLISVNAYAQNISGSSGLSIHLNGSFNNMAQYGSPVTQDWSFSVTGAVVMNGSSDYVEVFGFHNTAASRTWQLHFLGRRIGT